ncbi:N-acetylglutaminylglutamine synthetase [Hyphobacterium sp. HN65]|uniref:N-acetylglutaminylglutamine synthetase n=1 Tax=Hyphobacterium lacteum TaxID=3116575 RepID=A0ABU7LRQ5_9PROT|nr:N-acetylglutaminylglutamine synthetase [Hyphobacterium sp. HN65]MEE2526560.1 N-acetylglutaminylglutamine synthetase [Hyphobacterium sp. HN65]
MTSGEKPAQHRKRSASRHRLERLRRRSGLHPPGHDAAQDEGVTVDCGWGRLVFCQTFPDNEAIASELKDEGENRRDIAFYVRDPHVLLAIAPTELFLDPSHTYRLDLGHYKPARDRPAGFTIRRLSSASDAEAINRIYAANNMVRVDPDFLWHKRDSRIVTVFVAEDNDSGEIIGTVTGVDHGRAFDDPERGSSLWCLAADPKARLAKIGEALTRHLAAYFQARGCSFMDLSVLHDNKAAIGLYERLGFERVPFFAVKRKNPFNEELFTGPPLEEALNPYARIITKEARRRGIAAEVLDAEGGFFRLTHGGRSIVCRESLSELTSAVAMSRCDDKSVSRRLMEQAGLPVAKAVNANDWDAVLSLMSKAGQVVVKPVRGEQGRGVTVGISDEEALEAAVRAAKDQCPDVLVETYAPGDDLRVIVIGGEVVAAALRKRPSIVGDGKAPVRKLIEGLSRRRIAATDGESRIPIDTETERCVAQAGYSLDDILPQDVTIDVRKTANLHTGGTLHDVTEDLSPVIADASVKAAEWLDIPVVGLDYIVSDPASDSFIFIEANERPGLANHEPQPTAERFIDLLFPQTAKQKTSDDQAARH